MNRGFKDSDAEFFYEELALINDKLSDIYLAVSRLRKTSPLLSYKTLVKENMIETALGDVATAIEQLLLGNQDRESIDKHIVGGHLGDNDDTPREPN